MAKDKIEGVKALQKAFKAMPEKLAKKIQRKGMRKAAKPVLDTAKARVPVQFGDLEYSLKIRAVKRSRKRFGVKVSTAEKDNLFSGETFYGGFIEYGTSRARAHPFLRPAYDENQENVFRVFQNVVPPLIDQAAREARRGG